MSDQIQQLQDQITALQKEVDSLKSAKNLPREVENALLGRKFIAMDFILDPFEVYGSQTLGNDRTISLSGDPEDITVLEYPIYWGKLKGPNGQGIFIPLYVMPEF